MPPGLEQPVDGGEVGAELPLADRFEHLDRRDLRVGALVLAVVLLEDAHVEPGGALARDLGLRGRDGQPGDVAAVLLGGEASEAAPAAPDLEHAVGRLESQVLADAAVLAPLGVGERVVRRLEDGAGVRHRLVEHQLEEVVAEVVVVGDVAARADAAVAGAEPGTRVEELPQPRVPLRAPLRVQEQQLEQRRRGRSCPSRPPGRPRPGRACRASRAGARARGR